MEIVNKKLKALLLLIGMVVFVVPSYATTLTANAGVDQELNVTANNTVTVTLNGTASTGTIVKYEWFYNGDSLGTGATLNVGSVSSGYYTVTLVITDSLGNTASDTVNIEVLLASSLTANAGEDINVTLTPSTPTVRLNGTASTAGSTGTIVKYEWFYNGDSLGTGSILDVESVPPGYYTVTLTVTDDLGNTASDTVNIEVLVTFSSLKKTGQSISWYPKDDGDYQKGVTPLYTRDDAKEIVTDNITKLQWQDNEEAKTLNGTWQQAKNHCTNLNLGGYSDWRLPTRKELRGIVDYGHNDPSINLEFENTHSNNYWSSTSLVYDGGTDAWVVNFFYGGQYHLYKNLHFHFYIRCVRVGE